MSDPLIDIRPDHWKIVRDILQEHVPQYEVWAFGSRAKWTAKEYSDLDLAVIADRPLSLSVSASLSDDFSESDLPFKVDVVDWATTSESFRKIIERDKVVVQEATSSLGMAGEVRHFGELFVESTRNGLTRPKAVRGSGIKMVNMGELFAFPRLRDAPMDRVPLSDSEAERFLLADGDLLFARQSLVLEGAGRCSIFLHDVEPVTFESHVTRVRLDPNKGDARFYFYYLQSHHGRAAIRSIVEQGAGASGIRGSDLQALSVQWRPIEEQRAIAHILGTLDDKIELNRRMNETLEAMARALFKSWFVDFDPVRAKAEGRDPGLPKPLADLFPDSFQDSELGEIPKGWRVGKVGEFARLSRDGINPGAFPDEMFDHFSIPAFDEGYRPRAERGAEIKSNKFLVPSDGVLLSKLNPRIPRVWLPVVQGNPRAICSTEFLVALPRPGVSREFLYAFLSSDAFGGLFETLVTGTSGSHQRVKPEGLLNTDAVVPHEPCVEQFTETVQPLLARANAARDESCTLAALRDTLLPKLISGELRAKDAGRIVSRGTP